MGGAYVFPGGRVDAGGPRRRRGVVRRRRARRGSSWRTLPRRDAVAYHVAAARELFEEAGVLLARDAGGALRVARRRRRSTSASSSIAATSTAARDDAARHRRTRTAAPRARHARAVRALGDAADRHPPVRHALLHDARAAAPDAGARRDRDDAQRLVDAAAAIAQSRARRHRAAAADLERRSASSSRSQSVDDALEWARRRTRRRRQPQLLEQDGLRMLLVPGDPLHPEPWNEEPLAETRFVFVDGRWRPERARAVSPRSADSRPAPRSESRGCSFAASSRSAIWFCSIRHRLQPALDRDGGRGRAERAGHLGDRGARFVRAAGVHGAGAVVAISRGRRHLRLEQARVRAVRGVHDRMDVLGIEPAVSSRPALFRRRQRAVHRRTRHGSRCRRTARYFIAVASCRPRHRGDAERRRPERRQVAQQRRRASPAGFRRWRC